MISQGTVIPVCPSIFFVFDTADAQTSVLSPEHRPAQGNCVQHCAESGSKKKNFQK